jgi:carbonic anhydrase
MPAMPALQPSFLRAVPRLGAALLLACAGVTFAAEPKPAPAPRPIGVPDPMDVVRERLAQRLGVIKPSENVVRVVSKPSASSAEPSASAVAGAGASASGRAESPVKPSKPLAQRASAKRAEPSEHAEHAEHWDYQGGGGPERWGRMKPEFAKCSSGTRQSPIDIREGIKVELDPVQFDYKPSAFKVVDNGHTIQVNVAPGNAIEVMGQRFELVQFHFHRPSEERIDGKAFDMVAHLVHKNLEGRLAVVAVLLEKGSAQPVVQSVWNNLPLEKGDEIAARAPIDLNRLLPAERGYYTYMGSLTTPPCSEGVLWMVMKQPVPVSGEQIDIFARLYPMNARPIQSASGRLIKESN